MGHFVLKCGSFILIFKIEQFKKLKVINNAVVTFKKILKIVFQLLAYFFFLDDDVPNFENQYGVVITIFKFIINTATWKIYNYLLAYL